MYIFIVKVWKGLDYYKKVLLKAKPVNKDIFLLDFVNVFFFNFLSHESHLNDSVIIK